MRRLISILSMSILASAISASAQNAQSTQPGQAFAPGSADESQLAKEIRHNLLMLPYYSIFDDLSFSLNGTVVTLQGACPPDPPWDIKSDAANTVKQVKGVTQVVNNIKELPLSPMDWQIRRAVAKAIYGDAEIGMRYGPGPAVDPHHRGQRACHPQRRRRQPDG